MYLQSNSVPRMRWEYLQSNSVPRNALGKPNIGSKIREWLS